ncbi:MAG: ribosome maturation factor RimM [Chitinispirillales bacterium]|jgi:16S rRNA processing protein RimM|nr:ribosome maturation factor RimM [Chitinispirillales bacterium]
MELVAIGIFKRAIGLQGFCGVSPYGETFEQLKPPVTLYIGSNERSVRTAVLERTSTYRNGHSARFDIAQDRTEAEKLTGQKIFIPEDQLPELSDGRHYHFHLKGMTIVSESSGEKIGKVINTVNLPSMDALVVALTSGKEVIVPYNKQAVVKMDEENKVMTVSDTYIQELL